jgi:hypothetical protein
MIYGEHNEHENVGRLSATRTEAERVVKSGEYDKSSRVERSLKRAERCIANIFTFYGNFLLSGIKVITTVSMTTKNATNMTE